MLAPACFPQICRQIHGPIAIHGRWHAGGKGVHKENSVADLEACMDHLIDLGVSVSPFLMHLWACDFMQPCMCTDGWACMSLL